jgi:DNA-binding MarR family transcriptional regulator
MINERILFWIYFKGSLIRSRHSRFNPTILVGACLLRLFYDHTMNIRASLEKNTQKLPRRILRLPMYLMLTLVREGYKHAMRSNLTLRMPDYVVLAVLNEFGPCDQRSITERLRFDKSDVTKILNTLEAQGLIERKEDKLDGRRHFVDLTPKGKKQVEQIGLEISESMKGFLKGLTASEYDQLSKLLLKALAAQDNRFEER